VEGREEISVDNWVAQANPSVAFSEGLLKTRYLPVELSTPTCILTGHNSIVNTTLIHPHLPHVVTSGVERDIILHSPTPSSPCTLDLQSSPKTVREPSSGPTNLRQLVAEDGHDSESRTINFFDFILLQEGEADAFDVRQWDEGDEDG
jgi:WD repeat-containing protein 22